MTFEITEASGWINGIAGDTALSDRFLQNFDNPDSPVFYWYRVLWEAAHRAYELAWRLGWGSLAAVLVVFVVSVVIHHRLWLQNSTKPRPRPFITGAVSILALGAAGFVVLAAHTAFSMYDEQRTRAETALALRGVLEPDTPDQEAARGKIEALYEEYFVVASRRLQDYARDVDSRIAGDRTLSRQPDQDASLVLAGLLDQYRETEFDVASDGLSIALDGPVPASFAELTNRFRNGYRAYADLAEWTQRTALAAAPDATADAAYEAWNESDQALLRELRKLSRDPALEILSDQVSRYRVENGPWDVFRIRSLRLPVR